MPDSFGLTVKGAAFDLGKVVKRSRQISQQLNKGVGHLLKKNKVPVFDGRGRLNGAGKVHVEKEGKAVAELTAKHIILATGARARSRAGRRRRG